MLARAGGDLKSVPSTTRWVSFFHSIIETILHCAEDARKVGPSSAPQRGSRNIRTAALRRAPGNPRSAPWESDSQFFTVMLNLARGLALPARSKAELVSVYAPFLTDVVSQLYIQP